ncbi:IclR family transcriptional regulator [Limoniibacter endophyticus]|uniref:IclR family transcriptional regulator n=2 Tax=Limoniibacter endophyticus TaxID=1565040 RepID=A0A8J3DKD8_9HYPH|nr:IclR family transcriptional regulator [Limoniibacter endophyticus]
MTERGEPEIPAGTAALAKGLSLLDLIGDAEKPMRFADMLRASGLPKPTFSRILRTLVAYRLVRQDANTGTYTLGHRFIELSHRVWESFDLASAAMPELDRLSAELGETVALCRLDGEQALYMEERSGDGLGVRVDQGRRVPLHCTAAGKAMISALEPSFLRAITGKLTLEKYTDTTITDLAQLMTEVTLTRARGYAISYEEHLNGVNSVAAALPGRDGTPLGAIVVLGPSLRLDKERIHPVGRELMAAARRITGSAGTVAISSGPRPRTQSASRTQVDVACVLPWGAQLGEAPVWVADRLYWVDMLEPAIHRFDPSTGRNESRALGKLVSAVLPADDDRLFVASQDGIEELDFTSGQFEAYVNPEPAMSENRLNDAKVDPDGAIWVGSMRLDASKPEGSLYRITSASDVRRMETGITVSNGIGWTPDGSTLYFVDTVPGLILAYDVDSHSGALQNRRVFAKVPDDSGRPDGLAVDADGGVYCAIWDGWRVDRYLPNGKLDFSIPLPVPRPTSVAFGGADLSTLYITSARIRLPASTLAEAPLSGGLFACKPGHKGLPLNLFNSKA